MKSSILHIYMLTYKTFEYFPCQILSIFARPVFGSLEALQNFAMSAKS